MVSIGAKKHFRLRRSEDHHLLTTKRPGPTGQSPATLANNWHPDSRFGLKSRLPIDYPSAWQVSGVGRAFSGRIFFGLCGGCFRRLQKQNLQPVTLTFEMPKSKPQPAPPPLNRRVPSEYDNLVLALCQTVNEVNTADGAIRASG